MSEEYDPTPRRAVGERERREYDAFGPWMYAVERAEDLPPRFDPHWGELSGAEAIVKVPYHVERRDAKPGSDLYETVLALGRDGVLLLTNEGGALRRSELPYARIPWISLSTELLDARLVFGEAGANSRELRFNTVSEPLARRVVDLCRPRLRSGPVLPRPSVAGDLVPPPGRGDFHFDRLLYALRAKEEVRSLLAYQGPARVTASAARERLPWQRLLDALRPTFLDSAMILELPDELLVVRSGRGPHRGKKSFLVETTWLPLASLSPPRLERRVLANGGTVHALILESSGGGPELQFAAPPEASLERLAALARRP